MDTLTNQKAINKLIITQNAQNRILELLSNSNNQQLNFRVYIIKASCSGFEYGFAFDELADDDFVIHQNNIKVILDPITYSYINGVVIDYSYINKSNYDGFIITSTQAKSCCGCSCGENSCGCSKNCCSN